MKKIPALLIYGHDVACPFKIHTQIQQRRIKHLGKSELGFGSFNTARRTLHGYEAMAMIRKEQVQRIDREKVIRQISFIHTIFGIAA